MFEFNEDFDQESNDFVRVCISWEMKDSVSVNRGHCKDCGVDESSDYKLRKTQMFALAVIVDATQLSMHAKIPEKQERIKLMQAKKQSKDLVSAVADLDEI